MIRGPGAAAACGARQGYTPAAVSSGRDFGILSPPMDRPVAPAGGDNFGLHRSRAADVVAVVAAAVLSAAILLRYYDRMWLPGDDGYYAHIAQRVLAGEVLHRDVQALHPGYVYLVDALALRLFGPSLVSLRYPLVAAGIIQAALVAAWFIRRSRLCAVAAGVLFTSLSFVLFPTPSVHWYCLFVLVLIVCALQWIPRDRWYRLLAVGFLVGVEGFLRQLTGAFVGVGVLAYLLAERREVEDRAGIDSPAGSGRKDPGNSLRLARVIIGAFGLLLGAYLLMKSKPLAAVLFGAGVPALLAAAAYRASAGARETLRLVGGLAAGTALAAAPVLGYHVLHGSLDDWFRDSVVSALGLSDLDYVKVRRYADMLRQALGQAVRPADGRRFVNGAFWVALMAAPLALAAATGRAVVRRKAVHPLPFLAVFYAPVAVHYEAPAYLLFAAAPVAVGLGWFVPNRRRFAAAAVCGACALSAVALRYHAGQPVGRGADGAVAGRRFGLEPAGINGVGLKIGRKDAQTHARVLQLIGRESSPGDAILAVPGNAAFYFLSGRRNPTPYPYLVYGVMTEPDLQQVLETLRRDPPAVVIHSPELPYNTANTERVMGEVKRGYAWVERVGMFDVYVRKGGGETR